MKKCDIIIPIYNAFDCLKPCIDSVLKYTNMQENRIILINDKSNDIRVDSLLQKYAKKENIILLENTNNIGFVSSINKGIKYSKSDVLLLNSDTEVTSNWLEKIKTCAYSKDNVATVTPLSNNATLASVPKIFRPNDLFENYSLNDMAKLVEDSSKKEYPMLPTGHGFCIYIRRSALDLVGIFDEKSFGKGYGEENDFCFRCSDVGLIHLLCDDTYIYHKESQSFKNEKDERIIKGNEILKKRYCDYEKKLEYFCNLNPLGYIGNNVIVNDSYSNPRVNILYVIHDWKDIEKNLGGTTLHAYDLIKKLRYKYNFHVLAPENDDYKLYSYWKNGETSVTFPHINNYSQFNFCNDEYRNMIQSIIDNYKINILHIHHMIGNFFDIIDVAKKNNVYSIITLHDFYCICPLINKLYNNKTYCGNSDCGNCAQCLKEVYKRNNSMIETIKLWRTTWHEFLMKFDLILTPSESAKDEILMTYNDLNIRVIEHGIDILKDKSNITIQNDKVYNIAFVGAIGIHKGSNILYNLVNYTNLKKIRIHLFGIFDRPNQKSTRKFRMHGKYNREDLKGKIVSNNIKLICLFSTWPETYSYTLTESIACGVPVLAFDIGAIAERVKKYNLGWCIPMDTSPNDIVSKINDIFHNPDEYMEKIESINKYKIKTTEEMSKEYDTLYSSQMLKVSKINLNYIEKMIKESRKNTSKNVYNNYSWVFDTLKWKIIDKIKLPKMFKKFIRKD